MSITHEIGRAGGEFKDLLAESGKDVIGGLTDRNRSLLAELFKAPVKVGTGILGITLRTAARIAGLLGWNTAKLVGKAAASLPIVPVAVKR